MNSLMLVLLVFMQAAFGIPIYVVGWVCAFIHNYFSLGFMAFYEYINEDENE